MSISKQFANQTSGKLKIYLPGNTIPTNLPIFPDNAAALLGGLVAGDTYLTAGTAPAPLNIANALMRVY